MVTFCATYLEVKTAVATFWATFAKKIGLRFISESGHTGHNKESEWVRERERERETCKIAEKIKLLERDKIVSKNYCDNKRRTAAERNLVHST